MSFRRGRRKDGSRFNYPIEKKEEYVPEDLEVERIPSYSNIYEDLAREELERANSIEDFEERLEVKTDIVHRLSEAQDIANLSIRADFFKADPDASQDSRWEAIHMLDDANAIFLGVTNARYDPEIFIRDGYVPEKANSMIDRWSRIKYRQMDGDTRKRTEEEREKSRIEFKGRGGQY